MAKRIPEDQERGIRISELVEGGKQPYQVGYDPLAQ